MEKLKSGYSAGDKTINVQVDGYDLLPYLTGEGDKSSRQGLACFSDDGDVLALRFDNWRVVFMEQGVQGTLQIWLEPFDDLLERAGPGSDLASALRVYLERVPSRPDTGAWWERILRWAARRYERLAADPRFERAVTADVVVYAVAAVVGSLLVVGLDFLWAFQPAQALWHERGMPSVGCSVSRSSFPHTERRIRTAGGHT